MPRRMHAHAPLLALLLALPAPSLAAERSLEEVVPDIWRFQNDFHAAMVVVTDDGVVVTDPINAEAAEWLKAEIEARFGKPITHQIYSHSHGDHASGGAVFAAPEVIAHADAPDAIDGVEPTMRIDRPTSVEIGDTTFELVPLVPGHGNDMLVTVVRPQNVAFVVDVVSPGRVPYRDFPGADIDGLAEQIDQVGALDFDILLPGHAMTGDGEDVTEAGDYLDWLRAEVQSGLDAGRSVDEIKADLDMGPYADWAMADEWGPLNVEGMARWLQRE